MSDPYFGVSGYYVIASTTKQCQIATLMYVDANNLYGKPMSDSITSNAFWMLITSMVRQCRITTLMYLDANDF